eukprot:scaffold540871_cov37-Prasinocladus_malaysianus.AAC.1
MGGWMGGWMGCFYIMNGCLKGDQLIYPCGALQDLTTSSIVDTQSLETNMDCCRCKGWRATGIPQQLIFRPCQW